MAQRLRELSAEVAELESQLAQSLEVPSVVAEARLRELLSGLGDTAVQVFTEGAPKVMHRFSIGLELTYDDRTGSLVADIELRERLREHRTGAGNEAYIAALPHAFASRAQ